MKLDDSKILFVIHKQDAEHYELCLQSIQDMKIPQGMMCEILTWEDSVNVSQGILYNELARSKDAKYKIYIPDSTCFVVKNALEDIIRIFQSDASIGLLGASGALELTASCIWHEAAIKSGAVYTLQPDGKAREERYTQPEAMYAKVQCISDVLIATQYDWCWHETAHGNAAAAAHSLECIRQGYNVVVPRQQATWCLSLNLAGDCAAEWADIRHEYAPYLQSDSIALRGGSWLGRCGHNVQIGEKCQFINPGDILLYDNVAIGENCYIEAGKNISIGHDTIIEAEAYICGSGMAVQDGVPVLGKDWQTRYDGQVMIGHHSHLERKVTVLGNVEIGCGCL